MPPTTSKYRPDIDGLRAVAIIFTVGYHAFPKQFMGGFTGVDCFFVISGFLISGIIFDQLDKGVFSFSEFYARRIRRIFPAMLLVLTSIYVAGWWLMPGNVFEQLGKYIAAAAGFVVNLILYHEVGYFDAAAESKPLLHLWSLGIEEQFYILWPTLVVVAWRLRLNLLALITLIVVASFAANVLLINTDPPLVFYCTLTRLWELLMGAALARINLRQPGMFTRYANVQSVMGSIFLAVTVVVLNAQSRFPGWGAMLPVAGTLLIISAGPGAWINRKLLSNRIMVWVGLISYPLYMWHWPLLSYVWVMGDGKPSYSVRGAAVSIAVILAGLTYHLLERNVRRNKHRLIVPGLIVSAVAVFIIGMATYGGFIPQRNSFKPSGQLPPNAVVQAVATPTSDVKLIPAWQNLDKEISKTAIAIKPVATATDSDSMRSEMRVSLEMDVFAKSSKEWVFGTGKSISYSEDGLDLNRIPASAKTTLFVGDSHMAQYWSRINKIVMEHPEYNSAMFAALGACPPITHIVSRVDNILCPPAITVEKKLALRDDVDTVVITARWLWYFTEYGSGNYHLDEEYSKEPYKGQSGIANALNGLEDFIRSVSAHKTVFIVLDNPTGWPFKPLYYTDSHQLFIDTAARPRSEFENEINGVNIRKSLKDIAARVGAVVIDPFDTLCPHGMCPVFRPDGGPIYKDESHLAASYCRDFCDYMDVTVQPRSEGR